MLKRNRNGDPNRDWFFFNELSQMINLNSLLQEAYILINGVGLTYSDVKSLSKTERLIFIKLFQEDQNRLKNAI